jgi:3'(2'), 5'-bisphosphate nucleotidase
LQPTTGQVCFAIKNKGAFSLDKLGNKTKIHTAQKFAPFAKGLKVVTSSHNYNGRTAAFLSQFTDSNILHLGSAVKLMRLAEGSVNLCPRFGPTMEWDTAAPQIIIEEAGGQIVDFEHKKPLVYNKPNLENPDFLAVDCPYWVDGIENWELKIMS